MGNLLSGMKNSLYWGRVDPAVLNNVSTCLHTFIYSECTRRVVLALRALALLLGLRREGESEGGREGERRQQ